MGIKNIGSSTRTDMSTCEARETIESVPSGVGIDGRSFRHFCFVRMRNGIA
jgi:hypothetical protein